MTDLFTRIPTGHLLLAGFLLITGCDKAPPAAGPAPTCDIHAGPCEAMVNGRRIRLDIRPKPVRSMRELVFELELDGHPAAPPPYIDLDMPAMHMGYNRVYLSPGGGGTFTGTGVIVKCPSGLTTWQADVHLSDSESVTFVFDVRN